MEVPVIDADEITAQCQRFFEFGLVVDLYQHIETRLQSAVMKIFKMRQLETRDNQQDGVSAQRPRFPNLIRVQGEVLAQHRQ